MKPIEIINSLVDERQGWSDEALLAELIDSEMLPDEDDVAWEQEELWQRLYLFLALADACAKRQLIPAIKLLLQRACYGDPGETMRGLRHSLEKIVNPNWSILLNACIEASVYQQKGARLWAVRELGILRDAKALNAVISSLQDEAELVRIQAYGSLSMICRESLFSKEIALAAMNACLEGQLKEIERIMIQDEIEYIKGL